MKNIIASGCSFTSNGIGGVPPTVSSPGGCSYIESTDYKVFFPGSWAGLVAKEKSVTSFVNCASPSHGNFLVSTTIIELVSRYNYHPDDTLILFNISNFYRYDVLCNYNHPDRSNYIPWDKTLLDFGFLSRSSKRYMNQLELIDLSQIIMHSKNSIKTLFEFLDNNNYKFYYLWMEDYSEIFNNDKFLKKYLDKKIDLDSKNNMINYCINKNLTISENDLHPNIDGHKAIANIVLSKINGKN